MSAAAAAAAHQVGSEEPGRAGQVTSIRGSLAPGWEWELVMQSGQTRMALIQLSSSVSPPLQQRELGRAGSGGRLGLHAQICPQGHQSHVLAVDLGTICEVTLSLCKAPCPVPYSTTPVCCPSFQNRGKGTWPRSSNKEKHTHTTRWL